MSVELQRGPAWFVTVECLSCVGGGRWQQGYGFPDLRGPLCSPAHLVEKVEAVDISLLCLQQLQSNFLFLWFLHGEKGSILWAEMQRPLASGDSALSPSVHRPQPSVKLDLAPCEGKGRTSTKHAVKTRVKTKLFWGCREAWLVSSQVTPFSVPVSPRAIQG